MGWIVATTKPRREEQARLNVEDQGHRSYLPLMRETVRVGKSATTVRQGPLFPRYLFVDIDGCWRFLLGTRGVLSVVMCNPDSGPSPLPDRVINTLMSREKDGYIELPKKPQFANGQRVRIGRGCFEGHVGIYQGSTSLEREQVLLSILGRETSISVGSGFLTAVP